MNQSPAFQKVLAIEPGHEADAFPVRLRSLLTLEAFWQVDWRPTFEDLDALYAERLPDQRPGDFRELASRMEEEEVDLPADPTLARGEPSFKLGRETVSFASSRETTEGAGDGLRFITGFSGLADEERGRYYLGWLDHPTIRRLCAMLVLETRRQGATAVPPSWTDGNIANLIRSPIWSVYVTRGLSYYWCQENPLWEALRACARFLFSSPQTLDRAAFELYDEILVQHSKGNVSGALDGIRLLHELPLDHLRVEQVIAELIQSENAAVRAGVAELLACSPRGRFVSVTSRLAKEETAFLAVQSQIKALRLMGGRGGFDGLLEVATKSGYDYGAKLAARALAWVEHYPERSSRIRQLVLDRDRKTSAAASAAFVEAKYQSIFSFGGVLASEDEARALELIRGYVRSAPGEPLPAELDEAFAARRLSIAVDAGDDDLPVRVRILTAGGTPLVDDQQRPRELAARIARLPSVELPGWEMSDEELEFEGCSNRLNSAREQGDRVREMELLHELGDLHRKAGRLPEGLVSYMEEADIAREVGDSARVGLALLSAALVHADADELDEGIDRAEQGLAIWQRIGHPRVEQGRELHGTLLAREAEASQDLLPGERRIARLQRLLVRAREREDLDEQRRLLVTLSEDLAQRGQPGKAVEHATAGLALARETRHLGDEVHALNTLGLVASSAGDPAAALRHFQQATDVAASCGDEDRLGRSLINVGMAQYQTGQLERAIASVERALACLEGSDLPEREQLGLILARWKEGRSRST